MSAADISTSDESTRAVKPPRRWYQFRLRSLLILMAILSVPLAWLGHELRLRWAEERSVSIVKASGGSVEFEYFQRLKVPEEHGFEVRLGELREQTRWEAWKDRRLGPRVYVVDYHITDGVVQDLAPLAAFDRLQLLDISDVRISNLAALTPLDRLAVLFVTRANVDDWSALSTLPNLQTAILAETNFDDLAILSPLRQLENLVIDLPKGANLAPLADLKRLRWLRLKNVRSKDLASLGELRQLEGLLILDSSIDDISAIARLTNLKRAVFKNVAVAGEILVGIHHPKHVADEHEQLQALRKALPDCSIAVPLNLTP